MAWLPSSPPPRPRPRPVMNVTPLVDVVLVLLIIFMVVIPALEQSVDVQVPGIFNIDDKADEKAKPFILSVADDGAIWLDDEKIPPPALQAKLRAASRREPSRRLVLRADRAVPYGSVRRIYRSIQEVGFPGVSLRVNHRKEELAAATP